MITQTCSKVYNNVNHLLDDSFRMQKAGWEEVSVTSYGKGWGCLKTLFLWWLLPILAIFGRRPDGWRVVYKRQVSEDEIQHIRILQRNRRLIALAVLMWLAGVVFYCSAVTFLLQFVFG